MSVKGCMRTALWTEIREALREDFPDVSFPAKASPAIERVVRANADYIFELSKKEDHR